MFLVVNHHPPIVTSQKWRVPTTSTRVSMTQAMTIRQRYRLPSITRATLHNPIVYSHGYFMMTHQTNRAQGQAQVTPELASYNGVRLPGLVNLNRKCR